MTSQQPYFHISVVSEMLNIHPQTVRNYERRLLLSPSRTQGNMRLFSQLDVEKIKKIHTYTKLGVNLAGVEIIMKLLEQREQMESEMERAHRKKVREMEQELEKLKQQLNQKNSDDS